MRLRLVEARWRRRVACCVVALTLGACSEATLIAHGAKEASRHFGDTQELGRYKVGDPYKINGVWYYPAVDYDYDETGVASWYGPGFHGKLTANGEIYNQDALTAAHRTLPMPSFVRVTNLENGRSLVLRLNDRGPFAHGRIIDVSREAARLLGFYRQGTAQVRVQILERESREIARLAGARNVGPVVTAAPRPTVSTQVTVSAAAPEPQAAAPAPDRASAVALAAGAGPVPPSTDVDVGAPRPGTLYVQAGSFADPANAVRLKALLRPAGDASVTPAEVDARTFYRVRLGPARSVEEADALLQRVFSLGYTGARIVVE